MFKTDEPQVDVWYKSEPGIAGTNIYGVVFVVFQIAASPG
jgi:hypothetical protein